MAFRWSPGCCCGGEVPCVPCSDVTAEPYLPMQTSLSLLEPLVLAQTGGDCQYGILARFYRVEWTRSNTSSVQSFRYIDDVRTFFSGGRTTQYNGQIAGDAEGTTVSAAYTEPRSMTGARYVAGFFAWRKCRPPIYPDHYMIWSWGRRSAAQDEIVLRPKTEGTPYISSLEMSGGAISVYDSSSTQQSAARTSLRQALANARLARVIWTYPAVVTPIYRYNCDRSLMLCYSSVTEQEIQGRLVDLIWYAIPTTGRSITDAVNVDPDTGYADIPLADRNYNETLTIQVNTGTTEADLLNPNYTRSYDQTSGFADRLADLFWEGLYG